MRDETTRNEATRDEAASQEIIELLFFAYRDFVGDADERLQDYAFGRAHHRVLHFVGSRPGMTVAELLDILRITKQSLARVLRDVIEAGFVEARPGVADRRQRLLHLTAKGRALTQELTGLQSARIARALDGFHPQERAAVARFLRAMINPQAAGTRPVAGAERMGDAP
jgi:DNA-binding MarR family transcriptional regulator